MIKVNSSRLVAALAASLVAASAFGAVKWQPSFAAAEKQAKASNKLIMVEFYTSWSVNGKDQSGEPLANWCGRMEKETLADATSQKVIAKLIPVRVNIEKEGQALGAKFDVKNYPTLLFLDPSENSCGVIDGFETADEFVKHANSFLKDYADFPAAQAKHQADPKNLDAVARLAAIYADRYQIDMALTLLGKAEKLDPTNASGKLTDVYSNVGDYYQNASKFDAAIPYFKKEEETSKLTDKRAYGYLSIAACYFSKDNPADPSDINPALVAKIRENFMAAKPFVDACLKLPNLKDADKKIADDDMKQIQQITRLPDDGGDGGKP
ncbi:MAG TPA: hypothetical protein VMI31_10990 [Fimbriimonadaceae bacterium]|nr:hypothetical protein [Fimbriimonadaceae bacterium]